MHRRSLLAAAASVAGLLGGVAVGAVADPAPTMPSSSTPTEQVLLPAPDPSGPTTRGVFVDDPQGQIERIAAGGHLVAWSVRTPADMADGVDPKRGGYRPRPIVLPAESHVVVVDERGGAPLTIPLGARSVRSLRMLRGPGGAAEPQLAVTSCLTRKSASCGVGLYTLTPDAPLSASPAIVGSAAERAGTGLVDRGRQLVIGKLPQPKRKHGRPLQAKRCLPAIRVRTLATGTIQTLPAMPEHDEGYPRCDGVVQALLVGKYAFVTVSREDRADDLLAWFDYGIDTTAGPAAKWSEVQRPFRSSGGSTGDEIGPGITDSALYWEENDEDDGTRYSLERAQLPADVTSRPKGSPPDASTSDPIAPGTVNACDVAATDDAIYELANVRCAEDPWGRNARDPGYGVGAIRRIVNPAWRVPTN